MFILLNGDSLVPTVTTGSFLIEVQTNMDRVAEQRSLKLTDSDNNTFVRLL